MADLTVSNDIDTFMQSANNAAARNSLGLGNVDNTSDANKPVSTAQQAALDTEAATRLAADNRRAFAGGVYFAANTDSISPILEGSYTGDIAISFWIKPSATSTVQDLVSVSGSSLNANQIGSFQIGITSQNTINVTQRSAAGAANRITYLYADALTVGQWQHVVYQRKSSGFEVYVDGEAVASTSTTSAGTPPAFTDPILLDYLHMTSTANALTAGIRGVALHNRALSAAEVAELSEIGLGAWLAKHPEDKWGITESTSFENGEDLENNEPTLAGIRLDDRGGSTTTGTNYDGVADADGIGGARTGNFALKVVTLNAGRGMSFNTPADDTTYEAEFYYFSPTGEPDLELRNNSNMDISFASLFTGSLTTKDQWTKITAKWRVGTGNGGTTPWVGPVTAGTVYFDDVKITKLGTLAAYQMDEGIGRQLRDLSGRYDAILSETGYQHLQPKSEGYVRVKAADASSAIYMLEASDIIPADSVITDIIAEERKVAVANTAQDLADSRIRLNPSGSDLQIQRSDGTTHDTLGTITAPTSLSDIDAEIHYKQQAR